MLGNKPEELYKRGVIKIVCWNRLERKKKKLFIALRWLMVSWKWYRTIFFPLQKLELWKWEMKTRKKQKWHKCKTAAFMALWPINCAHSSNILYVVQLFSLFRCCVTISWLCVNVYEGKSGWGEMWCWYLIDECPLNQILANKIEDEFVHLHTRTLYFTDTVAVCRDEGYLRC